jgi:hypothetical protein
LGLTILNISSHVMRQRYANNTLQSDN